MWYLSKNPTSFSWMYRWIRAMQTSWTTIEFVILMNSRSNFWSWMLVCEIGRTQTPNTPTSKSVSSVGCVVQLEKMHSGSYTVPCRCSRVRVRRLHLLDCHKHSFRIRVAYLFVDAKYACTMTATDLRVCCICCLFEYGDNKTKTTSFQSYFCILKKSFYFMRY